MGTPPGQIEFNTRSLTEEEGLGIKDSFVF